MKRKTVPRKKKTAGRSAGSRKGAARKAASRKKAPRRATGRKAARRAPPKRKKTLPRAGSRLVPPSARPQPVPPGSEQPPQLAREEDEHGPMHLPSHKPAPAYAQMHKRDWAGQPPVQEIPVPKR